MPHSIPTLANLKQKHILGLSACCIVPCAASPTGDLRNSLTQAATRAGDSRLDKERAEQNKGVA
eukprot:3402941-Rhodomonas_salina.4